MPNAKELRAGDFYHTQSNIPKTARQKKMWNRSTEIVMRQIGTTNEKKVPWQLVTTIYKNAVSADKIPKRSDVQDAKFSKTIARYKAPNQKKSDNIK